MKERLKTALFDLGKTLAFHGGGVELVDFEGETGTVFVRLLGNCSGCGLAGLTVKQGLEVKLCTIFPEVKKVIAVQ